MNKIFIFFTAVLISAAGTVNSQSLADGLKHLENENYQAALEIFQKLGNANPKNAEVCYYIGEVYYALEDYPKAKEAYSKGLVRQSKSYHNLIGIAKLALDNGDVKNAEKNINTALKGNGKNAAAQALVGTTYLYSKNPNVDKALFHLIKARDLNPKQAKYWIYLGDAYLKKGDNGNAMTSYETAVEKDRNDPETYVKMSRIWAASKQLPLAIEKLESAIELAPDYALAYKELYELLIRNRNYDKVIPILQKYVQLSGTDVDAKVRLVKFLCYQAKDYEKAVEEGTKLLATNPEQYTLHRWLAWSYFELGKYQESVAASSKLFEELASDKSRKAYPSDYEYYAKAAAKIGDWETAESNYKKLMDLNPEKQSDICAMLAKAYFDGKQYPKSISWYYKKSESAPLNSTELYYLGLAQYYSDQFASADSAFAKINEMTPSYAQGWLMRARVNNNIDPERKLFLAKPYYEKYIEIASSDFEKNKKNLIEAYEYIAYYYVANDDKIKAKSYYEMILSLDPANGQAASAIDVINKAK